MNEQKSPEKQKSPDKQTVEEQADALLTNEVETDATIEAGWWQTMSLDSTEPPPDGSAAFHAQRLSEPPRGTAASPVCNPRGAGHILTRIRYIRLQINAVGCLRQWTALKSCGVVIAAEPTELGYTA